MANQVEKIQIDVELTAGKVDVTQVQKAIDHALASFSGGKKTVEIEFVGGSLQSLITQLEAIKNLAGGVTTQAVTDINQLISKIDTLQQKMASVKGAAQQATQAPVQQAQEQPKERKSPYTVSDVTTKRFELGTGADQALATQIKEAGAYENALRGIIAKNEVIADKTNLSIKQQDAVNRALMEQRALLQSTIELKQRLEGKADSTLPGVASDVIAVNKLNRELRNTEVELERLKALAPAKGDTSYTSFLDKIITKTEQLILTRQKLGLPVQGLQQELTALSSEKFLQGGANKVTDLVTKIDSATQALHALSQTATSDPIQIEAQRKALQALTKDIEKYYVDLQKFNEGIKFLASASGQATAKNVQAILSGNQQAKDLEVQQQTAEKLASNAEALLTKLASVKITGANQQGYLKQLQETINKLASLSVQTPELTKLQAQLKQRSEEIIQVKIKVTDEESLKQAIDRVAALETNLKNLQKGDISLDAKAKEFEKLSKEIANVILEYRKLEAASKASGKPLSIPFSDISNIRSRVDVGQAQARNEANLQRLEERRLAAQTHEQDLRDQEAQTSRIKFIRSYLPLLNEKYRIEQETARLAATPQAQATAQANVAALRREITSLNGELRASENIIGKAVQSFIRYGLLYQIFYGIKGAITGAVAEVFHFETALINIKAIAQATNQEMTGVSETILRIGENSKFSSTEIAAAATTLVQAGIGIEKLTGILTSVEQLAASTGSGIQETANLTTTFLQVFQDANPLDIADSLNSAVNISKLNVQDLTTISNYLLSVGKSYNENFKDILAVSATLKNAGLKASTIATNSRQALLELLSPDPKALKGLAARYQAIGENVSQDAVKAIFEGFKSAKDPLAAALGELQRLGIGQLGSEQLSRIFDVRSENVIKTLVQNKDALTANRVLLDDAGSAAQGAKVQMESLEVSLQNLREVLIGGLFDATDNSFKDLAKDVRDATKSVKDLLGEMNEFKRLGGRTGVQSVLQAAIPGAIAGGLKTGTIAGTVTGGLVAGGTAFGANTLLPPDMAQRIGEGVGFLGIFTAIVSLIKKIDNSGAIREAERLAPRVASTSGFFARLAPAFSRLAALLGATPWGKVITLGVTLLSAVGFINKWLFGSDLEELQTEVKNQMQAAEKITQEQKAKLEELKANRDKIKQQGDVNESFKESVKSLDKTIQTTLANSTKSIDEINAALADAAITSSQIGSKSLAEFAAKIGVSNQRVAAELVQEVNKNVAIGEALRKQSIDRRHLAQSRTDQGVALETDPLTLRVFNGLSQADQQTLQTPVLTKEGLDKYLELKTRLDNAIGKSGLAEAEAAIKAQEAVVNSSDVDKIKILLESAKFDPTASSKMRDIVDTAVESGSVSLVEAMVEAAGGFVDKRKINAAQAVAKSKAVDDYNKAVTKFADTQAAEAPALGLSAISGGSGVPAVKRNLKEMETEIGFLKTKMENIKQVADKLIAEGIQFDEINKYTEQFKIVTAELVQKQGQLKQLKENEVERSESMEVLNRRLIINNQQIADATHRLKIIQDTKAAKASEEVAIILEINKLKKRALEAEKITLSRQLALVLKEESGIDVGKATPEQILKELASKNGQEMIARSEKLGGVYKALLEITSREVSLREETVKDLSNVAVSAEKKKLAKQERELSSARDTLQRRENDLQAATQNLSEARQRLADALNQQQDVNKFFSSLEGSTKSAKQNLNDLQTQASFNPNDIEIQKALASAAAEALRSNQISNSEAQSIIDEARSRAQQAASANVDSAQSNFIAAQNNQQAAYELARQAYGTQVDLVESNRVLSEQIANLSSSLQATAQYLANNQSPISLSQDQLAQIQAPPGVTDVQPGTPKPGSAPKATAVFNFGGASIETQANQWEMDRFASQLSIIDRQKSLQ